MPNEIDFAALEAEALGAARAAKDDADLRAVERDWLDKKGGRVAALLARIPTLEPQMRREFGGAANRVKQALEAALDARRAELAAAQLHADLADATFDPTLPAAPLELGSLHLLTLVRRELEDIFTSMGYHVLEGPEIELEDYNFQKLNIPSDHPARDATDTFYCEPLVAGASLVLRTHTSPVQVRAMERLKPPFRAIAPGRVFRSESTDATHEHTFHQMEGLVVGEDVTVAQLVGTMKAFLRAVFRVDDLEVRLRPGFFPFVEPGFELDARCPFCTAGCRVCKQSRWIELCPCGMVHPNVLRAGGIDPERWRGFAFGLGLSRLVMLRYQIDDLRHLLGGDVQFLETFAPAAR